MGDETTKIFLNSKGRREGIDSDLAAFLDYIEGKAPKGKFTEIHCKLKGIDASCHAMDTVSTGHKSCAL